MNTPAWELPPPRRSEIPVDGITIRQLLSPRRDKERPMGASRFSAMKQAMGIKGTRHYYVSQFLAFMAAHPTFSEKSIYRREKTVNYELGGIIRVSHGPWEYRFKVVALAEDGRPQQLTLVTS